MRHEGFDFTKDVWNTKSPSTDTDDLWAGNSAIPYLIFNDENIFHSQLGNKFKISYKNAANVFYF